MKKKLVLSTIVCLAFIFNAFPQIEIDSLKTLLQKVPTQEKVNIYDQIIKELQRSNPPEAIIYSEKLIRFADSISDLEGKATGLKWLGLTYENLGRYKEGIKAWEEKIEVDQKLNNRKNVSYSLMALANCLQMTSEYDKSLKEFDKAEKIMLETDDKRGLGMIYGNMGLVYEKLGLIKQAVNYKYKSLEIAEKIGDSASIAHSLSSIASLYVNLKDYRKAIENYSRAIEIYERIGESIYVIHSISNLGVVYNLVNENQKALNLYHKGLKISDKAHYDYGKAILQMNLGDLLLQTSLSDSVLYYLESSSEFFSNQNLLHPLCHNYKTIGSYYLKVGDYPGARVYYLKAFDLSKKINAPDLHRDAAEKISELFEKTGDNGKALFYYKIFKHYNDSLFNSENLKEITRIEDKYQFEAENRKTELIHQAALSKKQTIIISALVGFLFVTILLILLFYEYRRKNAAYQALYQKSIQQINADNLKRNREGLKNGELFEQIEQKMQDEHLYRILEISQEMLADLLKTNRTYLSQSIIDHSGQPFRDYIKSYRIKEAMEFLSDKKKSKIYSIDAIAQMVGFNSIAPFNQAFKQITGLTPSQFRTQAGD